METVKSYLLCLVFKTITLHTPRNRCHGSIVDLPFGLVLKLGELGSAEEGRTMRFIRANTEIPVPRVLISACGLFENYTLMRRADGILLQFAWRDLSSQERANVIEQLRSIIQQLRSLPPPNPPLVSAHGGGPCRDSRVAGMRTFGPFQTVAEFNDFLIHAVKVGISRDGLAQIRPQMSDTYRVVFTHGDLAPRNIFVKGGQVVAIIDWEESGWFPEHWECVKAWWCPGLDKDWNAMIPDFIPQNYEEAVRVDQLLSDRMVGAI